MQKIILYIKPFLLALLFVVLFLPMLQNGLHLLEKTYPLKGDVQLAGDVDFDKQTWFNAEYQEQKEKHLNDNFGLRSLFVRLNNQLDFLFFNKANAKDVIIGKENYLYELNYIKAYTGEDFVGRDSITHTLDRLKFISDTLRKMNKQLLFVFAPGKASFYPEYIPDKYLTKKGITNYDMFINGINARNIDHIDFKKWFSDNKKTAKYPLYPQHGVHWSTYGTSVAIDILFKKIETLRNINMPRLTFNSVRTGQAFDIDYDVADGMNLLFKLKSFDLAYPNLNPVDTINKTKPKILIIGDSFYWGFYYLGIAKCFNENHKFWYYNKQVYPETFTKELLVQDVNLKNEVLNNDIIMVIATDNNLRNIGWGVLENLEKLFKGIGPTNQNKRDAIEIKKIITNIKQNSQWLEDTKKRAKERLISLDSALVLEALWQIQTANEKK